MHNLGFATNKIYLIESLPEHEKAERGGVICSSGEYFHNELFSYCNSFRVDKIPTQLIRVDSAIELSQALVSIKENVRANNEYPLVHFEIHGREEQNGITLKNRDVILWKELLDLLTDINEECKNNLFVIFATCSGAFNLKHVMPRERVFPYYAAIAPDSPEYPMFLEQKYSLFYIGYMIDEDMDGAFKELITEDGWSKIIVSTSEYYLYEALGNESKTRLSEENIARLVELLKREKWAERLDEKDIRSRILKTLNRSDFGEDALLKMKNKYLMANHPENHNRFMFSAKDIKRFFENK